MMFEMNAYDDLLIEHGHETNNFGCLNPLAQSGNLFFDDDCFVDQIVEDPQETHDIVPVKTEPTFVWEEHQPFLPWNESLPFPKYEPPMTIEPSHSVPCSTIPPPVQLLPQTPYTSERCGFPEVVFLNPVPLPSMPVFPEPMSFYPVPQEPKSYLNTFQFDSQHASFHQRFAPQKLSFDVSRALPNTKYSEIFQQYGEQLLLDKHPQFTEQDLRHIVKVGYIYFLKNVKTIVPKIGQEWRFISHVRSAGESSDRSYNLLGNLPLRCKVKEWMVDGDLWRMYHFVQGKPAKQSMAK